MAAGVGRSALELGPGETRCRRVTVGWGGGWATLRDETGLAVSTYDYRSTPGAVIENASRCRTTTYDEMAGRETPQNAAIGSGQVRA